MSDLLIDRVHAWEAFDSRGDPTVACEVELAGGARGVARVPAGASTGAHEARELRDGGKRYNGRGVRIAVGNVNGELQQATRGLNAQDQTTLDRTLRELDGTADLRNMGANAVLAVSIASAIAVSVATGEPLFKSLAGAGKPLLPLPMVNILSGGAHAGWALDIQDYLVVPVGATSFTEAIEWAWRVRTAAASVLEENGHVASLVADEGGLAAALPSNRAALEVMVEAIERAELQPEHEVAIAIDVAATQLSHRQGEYDLPSEGRSLTSSDLIQEIAEWASSFPIVSIEDPLSEDDWDAWERATKQLGHVQLLGDDLFVTDVERLSTGMRRHVANAILVKPNQTGTLSGALDAVRTAHRGGYATVLSARSGETEDTWLADLAVAWRTGQIKVGSTTRSERTAKWNRLLQIETMLGDAAEFAGSSVLAAAGTSSTPPLPPDSGQDTSGKSDRP